MIIRKKTEALISQNKSVSCHSGQRIILYFHMILMNQSKKAIEK